MTTVGIVYTAEVAHSRYRPMLLSLNSVNVALGILLATVLGAYLSWRTCALVFGAMGIISTTMSLFIPESPLWLVNFTESSRELIAKHVRSLNRSEWAFPCSTSAPLFSNLFFLTVVRRRVGSSPGIQSHEENGCPRRAGKGEIHLPAAQRENRLLFLSQRQSDR
ncbi:unnamed protein product [Nesidiocoris tenuis]|uniref:Major facilitator superfamily (MFS) profile domain-containing protein n=1 Tax=Nesidiocoris tenuis TaxID=355587 RepID=A0A6H5FWS0_9HEMI|nr:unnamed protein product [Nesidiocoris tenuis]